MSKKINDYQEFLYQYRIVKKTSHEKNLKIGVLIKKTRLQSKSGIKNTNKKINPSDLTIDFRKLSSALADFKSIICKPYLIVKQI